MTLFFYNRTLNVGRHDKLASRLHGKLPIVLKLYIQALLDSVEEKFSLQATVVHRSECQQIQITIVGKVYKDLFCLGFFAPRPAQNFLLILSGLRAVALHRQISDGAHASVGALGLFSSSTNVCLCADFKVCADEIQYINSVEIQTYSVFDITRMWLDQQQFEHVDSVYLAFAEIDRHWLSATQFQELVLIDCRPAFSKGGTVEETPTMDDSLYFQRIHRALKIQADQAGVEIMFACSLDVQIDYTCSKAQVTRFVSVADPEAMLRVEQVHSIKFRHVDTERHFEFTEPLSLPMPRKQRHGKRNEKRHSNRHPGSYTK